MKAPPTYADFAADLRALASVLQICAGNLPLPLYPQQGLSIQIHMASAADVDKVAQTLDVKTIHHDGYTTAQVEVDTIRAEFIHVEAAAMAAHRTRQDFAATMPDGWPASTLHPLINEPVSS